MPLLAVLVAWAFATAPGAVEAQIPEEGAAACPDGRISYVFVDNRSIFDLDELPLERFAWAYRLANRLHVKTRRSFIAAELLFGVGDCYDPFLLADSERLIRRFSFIAEVEVFGLRQDDGTWHVVVDTRDEWSTRVEVSAEFENGVQLEDLSLSELNFLGRGATLTAFLTQQDASRSVGAAFSTPRLFGTATDLLVGAGGTRVGEFYNAELTYPFLGEVGRFAWRVGVSRQEDFFDYSSGTVDEPGRVLLPLDTRRAEATWAMRFGEPGNLTMVGVGVARETVDALDFPQGIQRVDGRNFGELLPATPEAVAAVTPQTFFASGTRVNLLFSQRNIRFIQRTGLDALQGVQDLELGSEVSLTLGRTVGVSGVSQPGDPEDLHTRFRLYAAGAPGDFVVLSQFAVDGRQVFFEPEAERTGWRDMLGEVDVLAYWQPESLDNHTFVGRFGWSAAWTMDRPFQLTLGGETGVRGYAREALPGGQRIVVNLEDRYYLGWPAPDLFDLGVTTFADIGRTLPGDVPFGQDSGWRGSVGAGLRIGFPAGSRDVIRLDLAWPVDGSGVGGPLLRIALSDVIGLDGGLEDEQMRRSRLVQVGPDRFTPIR